MTRQINATTGRDLGFSPVGDHSCKEALKTGRGDRSSANRSAA